MYKEHKPHPIKLMLRNHSSALTLVSSHVPLTETCCTSCSHMRLPCFHQSAGNCSPCSCDPVYHPFTTTPAEDVTQVCQHDRQEEEWQKDMTGGGLFCQERNYCKATHLCLQNGSRAEDLTAWPCQITGKERRGGKKCVPIQ